MSTQQSFGTCIFYGYLALYFICVAARFTIHCLRIKNERDKHTHGVNTYKENVEVMVAHLVAVERARWDRVDVLMDHVMITICIAWPIHCFFCS